MRLYSDSRSSHDDRDLWEAFKSGNQQAYAEIYKTNAEPLFRYGMQLCADEELVEDMIHDIFVDIWEKRKNLSEVKSIRLYLKFSLRRRILRKLKRINLFQNEEVLYQNSFKFSVQAESLAREAEQFQELSSRLLQVLDDLSPRQREVIYLRFYQDMSYDEIAELLSLDISYVYNLSSRAYAKIKASLSSLLLILLDLCLA